MDRCAVDSAIMMQRQRSPYTVDVTCAHCGKPMMMLKFNYTTLERGFESISLRCQYCRAEETRPWPRKEDDDAHDQQIGAIVTEVPPQRSVEPVAGDDAHTDHQEVAVSEQQFYSNEIADDSPHPSSEEEAAPDEPRPLVSSEDMPLPDKGAPSASAGTPASVDDDYERMRLRFAGRPPLPPAAPATEV